MASLSRAERETVIQWDMEGREVSIWSCLPGVWKRCERAGWRLVESVKDAQGREIAMEYVGPLAQFGWRVVSEATRKARSEKSRALLLARGGRVA